MGNWQAPAPHNSEDVKDATAPGADAEDCGGEPTRSTEGFSTRSGQEETEQVTSPSNRPGAAEPILEAVPTEGAAAKQTKSPPPPSATTKPQQSGPEAAHVAAGAGAAAVRAVRWERQAEKRGGFPYVTDGPSDITVSYRLDKRELGSGHFGTVSRCQSIQSGDWFACKKIRKSKVRKLKNLKNEIKLLRSMDHPSIIRLVDVFEDDLFLYIVMELCTGGELFDRIIDKTQAGSSYGEKDAARIMRQVFRALEYCHGHNIVHRDLKPENLLFRDKREDSDLVIIDFGLSREFEPNEMFMSTKVGTPYYVAPEVLRKSYTSACDLWSAGVILYILLCGTPPFYGDNDADVLRKVASHSIEFPSRLGFEGVSTNVKDLILQLCNKDPSKRPTAAQALSHPWFVGVLQDVVSPVAPATSHLVERVHSSLRHFVSMNRLKRIALKVIAEELSEAEIGELRGAFEAIDRDKNGYLSIEELKSALAEAHGSLHQQITCLIASESTELLVVDLPILFPQRSRNRDNISLSCCAHCSVAVDLRTLLPAPQTQPDLDLDEHRSLNYQQFVAATMERRAYVRDDRIRLAFDHLTGDSEQTTISQAALVTILGSEAQAREILAHYDANGDSEISFEEFKSIIRSNDRLGSPSSSI